MKDYSLVNTNLYVYNNIMLMFEQLGIYLRLHFDLRLCCLEVKHNLKPKLLTLEISV